MHDALVTFCHWLQNTPMALMIGHTPLGLALVQLIHIGGFSVWVFTNAALDISLMGFGGKYLKADKLSDQLFFLNWAGFAVAALGGFLWFSVAAGTYIGNIAFETKLGVLVPLGLFTHILIQIRVPVWGKLTQTPAVAKITGAFELLLWIGVIIAGVAIPYV